jgi:hypothetical protein
VVGHAVKIRYDAGNWRDVQYGRNLEERERRMIEGCDSAAIIWVDNSGVIAGNLERLKRLGKPTYLYEYSSKTSTGRAGELDPKRTYDPFYFVKKRYRKRGWLSEDEVSRQRVFSGWVVHLPFTLLTAGGYSRRICEVLIIMGNKGKT